MPPGMTMTGTYDTRLVALSVALAILASYTALDLAGRVTAARGPLRRLWLGGGAVAMGLGIWAMHFVGMLAFHPGVPMSYDLPTVLASLLAAILVAGVALFVASRRTLRRPAWLAGGVLMGAGIGAMHYSGMAALRLPLALRYAPVPVALSLAIAVGASLAALGIAFRLRSTTRGWLTVGGAVAMGAAIAGMHYMGMAAAVFTMAGDARSGASGGVGTGVLAVAIALATLIVLGFALLASLVDRRLSARAAEADALRRSEERLRALSDQLRHQATHDALTGLPNRALLYDQLERAARAGARHALLFLDLDDFKMINDSLGHAAGDALLVEVGARLGGCVRAGDTVARLGGDEFAILLADSAAATADEVAARIADAFARPVTLAGRTIGVATSIGIALGRDGGAGDGRAGDALLRDADAAMYAAKRAGKGRHAFFEPGMHDAALDRLDLTADLRRAIAAEEIAVHYQPIVALEGGVIARVEALARWTHPARGSISPATFIPLAEESDLIVALDALVLRRACAQARAWDAAGLPAPRIAVNLSGRGLRDPALVRTIARTLAESGLAPGRLELELTESVAVDDGPATLDTLTAIRALGVGLALDDFGTGYSILRRLHRLPFTTLKIDQGFIRELATAERETAALVRMMVGIGQSLGLAVVAEGVETMAHAHLMREYGCAYAQGYAFSRPVEADALARLLRLHRAAASAEAASATRTIRPLLGELERLTGLETTYLTRIDWARAEQEVAVAHNAGALVVPEGLRVAWADTLCRRVLEGGPRYTADVPAAYPESTAARELGLRTYVSVPVVGPERAVVGTLCGASRASVALGASALAVMERVAAEIADQLARDAA